MFFLQTLFSLKLIYKNVSILPSTYRFDKKFNLIFLVNIRDKHIGIANFYSSIEILDIFQDNILSYSIMNKLTKYRKCAFSVNLNLIRFWYLC